MSRDAVNGNREPRMSGLQYWNTTMATLSHGANNVIRIEVLVSLVACVLMLLAIFGAHRRRSRNCYLQKVIFVAYTLSFSMATYILGSMQSSAVKSSMYPIWTISLIMLHGSTDSITAYSLHDNKQITRLIYQTFMYYAYALLLLATVGMKYNLALIYMVVIAIGRYAQRFLACYTAAYSWHRDKKVADYMYDQQNGSVCDPATMEDCTYLVDWPEYIFRYQVQTDATQLITDRGKYEVIDIGQVWRCKDMSLVPELKDACLSFSLFHLLKRRFFGFACDESKAGAHDFVFKVLLSENQDGTTDYSRVFKVIEVELAFMYDFFFTKSAVMYYAPVGVTYWFLVSVIGISITAYLSVRAPVKITQDDSSIVSTVTDDVVITLVILASTALLEFLQLLLYLTGIWSRVSFVCRFLREQPISNGRASHNKSCITILKEFFANIGMHWASNKHYWQHKLGQYSLLDSVSYNPNPTEPRYDSILYYLLRVRINYRLRAVRNKGGKYVELPAEVKEALIRSLKRTDGTLSNGNSSLVFNEAQHLSWACAWAMHQESSCSQRKQNQTHIILTWHIATWYCETVTLSEDVNSHFVVATKLSKYCAHLVVCAPKLLPGHHYDTSLKLDAAAVEAIAFLEKARNKSGAMKSFTVPEETKTIFESGVKLANQLEEMAAGLRWKVMADFWAEMMLYLAPSDNVQEHIEKLAQGGEFITHLWALLSHAGILKRDQEPPVGGA